jgi:glycosyltransferase involved in cell wall biosynthesis
MTETKKPEVSVVIPTYNEEGKAKEMKEHLDSITAYFDKINKTYEVVIILDGPTDKTPQLVKKETRDRKNFLVIDRKKNKGKGYSVREGMMKAKGKIRLFTDMDGATPIEMLDRFFPEFKKGADIVIGSRDLAESEIKIHQPKWKELMGDTGNLLIQAGTGLWGMKDTQCGFKAFREEAVEDIVPRATIDRWGLDFELLMIGKKRGYEIAEVPVEWLDRGVSLVGISGYISTFRDLFKVKLNMLAGVYQLGRDVKDMEKGE